MRRFLVLERVALLGAAMLPCAFGYIPYAITTTGATPQTIQLTRADGGNLQFYLNNQVVAGATSTIAGTTVISATSNPTAAVELSMASWNNVGAANVVFLPLQSTTVGHNSSDCLNVISIASTTADVSVLGGANGVVALTINSYLTSPGATCGGTTTVNAGTIIDSDILLNPYMSFSTTSAANTRDVQAVLTHEFGHSLGMNHSGLLGSTMFPYTSRYQRHLSWDEKSYAAAYYPSGTKSLGTISGTITVGGSPVEYGLITAIDQTGGKTIGSMTACRKRHFFGTGSDRFLHRLRRTFQRLSRAAQYLFDVNHDGRVRSHTGNDGVSADIPGRGREPQRSDRHGGWHFDG
jgi:hypothetical protein